MPCSAFLPATGFRLIGFCSLLCSVLTVVLFPPLEAALCLLNSPTLRSGDGEGHHGQQLNKLSEGRS